MDRALWEYRKVAPMSAELMCEWGKQGWEVAAVEPPHPDGHPYAQVIWKRALGPEFRP